MLVLAAGSVAAEAIIVVLAFELYLIFGWLGLFGPLLNSSLVESWGGYLINEELLGIMDVVAKVGSLVHDILLEIYLNHLEWRLLLAELELLLLPHLV